MYNYFSGQLVEITPTFAVIECNGVGYHLNISLNTYMAIKDLSEVKLFTHFVVREDIQLLYGFFTKEECEVFKHLLTVSGIGPNTARVILSSLTGEEVVHAILGEEVAVFQQIKGIGGKTAQRVIIDLKDKIGKVFEQTELKIPSHNRVKNEALSALVLLGFNKSQVEKVIEKVYNSFENRDDVGLLVKQCLKLL